jgi:4,5-dihydroxyphthalate decarboxylase
MAFSTYLCARAHGKAMTALPIFLLRRFEHGQIVYNVNSDIKSPQDLHGRRVGVRSYTLTPGVWTRGILQHTYGVDPTRITWVLSGDEHVEEYDAPPNVSAAPPEGDLQSLLLAGEIDAAIGVGHATSADIQPLIPDPQQAGVAFYRQSGIYPISHLVVVKNDLLKRHAWLAPELCAMFKAAKEVYLTQLDPQDKAIKTDVTGVHAV